MRSILIDSFRRRSAQRRGGAIPRVPFEEHADIIPGWQSAQLQDLDAALQRLKEISPIQSRIVEMQFFGGMTVDEMAQVLRVSPRTVDRHWHAARAWLLGELTRNSKKSP